MARTDAEGVGELLRNDAGDVLAQDAAADGVLLNDKSLSCNRTPHDMVALRACHSKLSLPINLSFSYTALSKSSHIITPAFTLLQHLLYITECQQLSIRVDNPTRLNISFIFSLSVTQSLLLI